MIDVHARDANRLPDPDGPQRSTRKQPSHGVAGDAQPLRDLGDRDQFRIAGHVERMVAHARCYAARSMTGDIRDDFTDLVQQAVEEAIAQPETAAARIDRIVPPGSIPDLEGWPTPSPHARQRAQAVVCLAVTAIEALDPRLKGDIFYTGLAELPEVDYSFKTCTNGEDLALAPLVTHCLSERAGHLLAVLTAYRFNPLIARHKTQDGEVDLFRPEIRTMLAHRVNCLALVESNLWFLASLEDSDIVPPYAVRYDLARFMWDRRQPGHILCLRCGCHVHYRRDARLGTPREGRCRPCSRGRPDDWPTHAIEPDSRGTWWLHCQTQDCPNTFAGRAHQLGCPQSCPPPGAPLYARARGRGACV